MDLVLIQRLGLLSSLSALVLAVLWPHLKPNSLVERSVFFERLLTFLISDNNKKDHQWQKTTRQHPRFTGQNLIRKAHGSSISSPGLYSHGQSSIGRGNVLSDSQPPMNTYARPGGSFSQPRQLQDSSQANHSVSLTVFSTCVLAIILFTMLKMLTSKLAVAQQEATSKYSQHQSPSTDGLTDEFRYQQPLKSNQDKRSRARQTREDRARNLILRHGGKNVATAIRMLAKHLEQQKLFLSGTPVNESTCNCSCHNPSSESDGVLSHLKLTESGRR